MSIGQNGMPFPRPPLLTAVMLSVLTVSISSLLLLFYSRAPDTSELALASPKTGLKPGAILTMIVAPKALGRSRNANSRRQMRFIIESWADIDRVEFIIVSCDHEVLAIAREVGIASIEPDSGNDVEDLTYRSLFRMVDRTLPIQTEVVGFSNGDILYDDTLSATVEAVLDRATNLLWKNFAIVGQRTNVDVPNYLLNGYHSNQLRRRFQEGTLFQPDAQDYFIFNRGINLVWDCIPPFLVGGVYFDNWFTGLLQSRPDVVVVDATETLKAYHINHGKGRHESHESAASMINLMIGIDAQNHISKGSIKDSPWATTRSDQVITLVPRTLDPAAGDDHYARYAKCHIRGKPVEKKGQINRLSE